MRWTLLAPLLPEFFGGSADLTGSNLTNFKGCTKCRRGCKRPVPGGNHLSLRRARIRHGRHHERHVALHGGYIPFGGTFLTFSDYSRNAIRMAALMKRA
jgi:transketolase